MRNRKPFCYPCDASLEELTETNACNGYWSTNDSWQPLVSIHYLALRYGPNSHAYIKEGQWK